MESERKIFSSNIIRSNNKSKNNLYDILNIVPVQPLSEKSNRSTINDYCDFIPKKDKFYIPKKKNGRKVKTIRDIRNSFEREMYSFLPTELEKQRNTLFRKIRFGSTNHEKTKEIATNMLKSELPMSKSAWQMLMNINPEGHKFSSQYIFWEGKCIQINGSKGGPYKFICKYNVGNIKQSSYKKSVAKSSTSIRKKRLLHHSLVVKFKPGPLSRKKDLDISYQKYQFGEMELVTLPKPGLVVHTNYGKPLAPAIDNFLHKSFFYNGDGLISQKWANFAVSVLGKNNNGTANQNSEDSCVVFDLNYKNCQHKILMRHDKDIFNQVKLSGTKISAVQEEPNVFSEVRNVMDKVLDAVEISVTQDDMYSGEDEPREIIDNTFNTNSHSNNKIKRKFGELDRLDVTVIRISETAEPYKSTMCQNDYCALGCVCNSLNCSYNLKRHCGRIECMFKCKCDFSRYKYMNSFDNENCSDIIPGLINLDKRLGQTLAKEEHKFHQTVIVTDEKSILLKSDRRNWKTSKKYADFYSNMRLKTARNTTQMLSIVCSNLDCKNVEPWCMVHNLYKCFCKGKFTETGRAGSDEIKILENENAIPKLMSSSDTSNINEKSLEENMDLTKEETNNTKERLRNRGRQDLRYEYSNKKSKKYNISNDSESTYFSSYYGKNIFCSRLEPYNGRKYSDGYYYETNRKILEMEKNDKRLHKKMVTIINHDEEQNKNNPLQNIDVNSPATLKDLLISVIGQNSKEYNVKDCTKRLPYKTKLVAWLEKSYKQYKQRADQGLVKISLDPPKAGRLCLYSWNFILSRYRERKNYFLISKQKPYRIFMAIDINNSFFDNCTNISDINLTDIDKYPITVKNLLTNATDLKENFCILCGLLHCWELIGSVTKVNEIRNTLQEENQKDKLTVPKEKCLQLDFSDDSRNSEELPVSNECDTEVEFSTCNEMPEQNRPLSEVPISKWFVMKVENDFSEIQFYKKGFFVKYESVVKAINVARVSGKTVRLSSQKCTNDQNDPQFGIYAIPSNEDCCVFIGPYEKEENLGIEAIKKIPTTDSSLNLNPQFRTRGNWITTNKVDNLKVIDNPLLFISSSCLQTDKMLTLEGNSTDNYSSNFLETQCNVQKDNISQPRSDTDIVVKQVKPIKIRKTNGFYQLTSNGCLKPIRSPEKDIITKSLLISTNIANLKNSVLTYSSPKINQESRSLIKKPVAEIAPQIKEVKVSNISLKRKLEGGMLVLKPEEINKRSLNQFIEVEQSVEHQRKNKTSNIENETSMDIERFLATSVICSPPKDEIYLISDEESECNPSYYLKETCANVWIVCKTIENLGWIAGKRNSEYCLSFEFPGFNSTPFYPECEALQKISQIFVRKIYVPSHIDLEWSVLESEAEIKTMSKLEETTLNDNYTLIKIGQKYKVVKKRKLSIDKETTLTSEVTRTEEDKEFVGEECFKQNCKIINDLEDTSNTLEEESSYLWEETISKKDQIMESFSAASEELRKELTEQLNCIISNTED